MTTTQKKEIVDNILELLIQLTEVVFYCILIYI